MTSDHSKKIKAAINNAIKLLQAGRLDDAELQAEEILKHFPGEPNALRLSAGIKREQKLYQDSIKILQQCINESPNFAMAHQDLGYSLSLLGDIDAALISLRQAVSLDKTLSLSWHLLGELNTSLGNDTLAEQAFNEYAKHSITEKTLAKAAQLYINGHLGKAEDLCRSYLLKNPKDVNAIRLLAEIGIKIGVFDDAEVLLRKCLELAPDYHYARLNYAQALQKREKFLPALEQIEQLEQGEPNKPSHLLLKASILAKMGNFDEAIRCYNILLNDFKPQANIALSLGHALKTIGQLNEAITAYRQAIELQPENGEAYWSLANLKTFKFDDRDIGSMKLALENPKLEGKDKFHLHFAMGKALEDRKQYKNSFLNYEKGNYYKKQTENYNAEFISDMVSDTIAACPTSLFAHRKSQGNQAADPIFIVGLPRSGSTLLEQILASHSQVEGTKELHDIIAMSRRLSKRKKKTDPSLYPAILNELTAEQLNALGEEYLERTSIQRIEGRPFFIDKMPNNWMHVGLIKLILPNAKIIDARRQPMGACFSGYKQLFASGQSFSYSQSDIAQYYCDYIRLMDHWQRVLPGEVLHVQYEDVVADTENSVKRLLAFCELPFEENCLQFHQNERAVKTPSSEQVRQPIYTSSTEHWRNYEPYLLEMLDHLSPVLAKQ